LIFMTSTHPQVSTAVSYLIGVDTGGTYTDAAIIEAQGHRVIASAKAITTKGDLAIGVTEAITQAVAKLPQGLHPQDISMVSVSTTLATNAVVEGHGSAVGVLLIGFDAAMVERTGIAKAFPGMPVEVIAGGHDHNGDAPVPLDLNALDAALQRMTGHVGSHRGPHRQTCDLVNRVVFFAGRAPQGDHGGAECPPDFTRFQLDRGGEPRHARPSHQLPADDCQR
jgi:hypothetical protein